MKRILFIDLRNSVCSQIAQAWFNQFALNWGEADSCGTMPASLQDPITVQVMSEVGCDLHQMHPRAVSNRLLARADIVVMMGRNVHPDAFAPDVIWDFSDPTGKSIIHYRVQRDAIRQAVQELIADLSRKQLRTATDIKAEMNPTEEQILMQMLIHS